MSFPPRKPSRLRYLLVADALRQKIVGGEYADGECLPRQHELARQYQVAFNTLNQALDLLDREGYLVRKVGQGTFARLPEKMAPIALVVDDDPSIRHFFARALVANSWQVTTVDSGIAALERVEEQKFDVIFLDLIMAGMNGAETFKAIRGLDPGARVVVVTAFPDSTLMAQALETGPFAVIMKPFTLEQLRTVLDSLVSSDRSPSLT